MTATEITEGTEKKIHIFSVISVISVAKKIDHDGIF